MRLGLPHIVPHSRRSPDLLWGSPDRDPDDATAAAEALPDEHGPVSPHQLDVTDPGRAAVLAAFVGEKFARLDGLTSSSRSRRGNGTSAVEVHELQISSLGDLG